MAEFSGFWTTGGATGDQQAVGYTQAQWSTACAILAAASGFEGVAQGYGNELAATDAGGGDIKIDTGGAVVDGKWYDSTSAVTVNIPTPAAGNERIDRIVARCTWAGFIVRITRIAGIAAPIPVAPAITQTSGAIYDIALWQARITDGGVITLTDERTWAGTDVDGVTLQSVAGVLSIADGGVDTAQLANNAVTPAKLSDRTRTFFVPAVGGINVTVPGELPSGMAIVLPDAVQAIGFGSFSVPVDFVSTMTVSAVVTSDSSGYCYASQEANYGAAGEIINKHTASAGVLASEIVAGRRNVINTTALASAAVGDYVNLLLGRFGDDIRDTVNGDVRLMGWLVSYTADS